MNTQTRRVLAGLAVGFSLLCFTAASGCAKNTECQPGQSTKQALGGLVSLYGAYRLYKPTNEAS